jgi:predicted dehydrogenase
MTEMINWGMIGCGDVTELKSGPAFSKVPDSKLVAVMSRSAERAADYAKRHQVAKWYDDAQQLIDDPEVHAIYIATPPLSHEQLTIAALRAGKPVYVEKPMAVHAGASKNMLQASYENGTKLTVAHYRREQPVFRKIKSMLAEHAIGQIKYVNLKYLVPALSTDELQDPKTQWRIDPAISGGGLFHDMAPHQLDLMLYFFGPAEEAKGISTNQAGIYPADDLVTGVIRFASNIVFTGTWCFSAPLEQQKDVCEIVGTEGQISFPVFGKPQITLNLKGNIEIINFEPLQHVQQPMIDATVRYFLNKGPNPGTAENGLAVMELIDKFSSR